MHLLGLFAAMRVVRVYVAYYQYAWLVCCKSVEELDVSVLWVELGL